MTDTVLSPGYPPAKLPEGQRHWPNVGLPCPTSGIANCHDDKNKIVDSVFQAAFYLKAIDCETQLNWWLHNGDYETAASMKDERFIQLFNDGSVPIDNGNIFVLNVRMCQWLTNDGLKCEYEVIEVIKDTMGAYINQ